MAVDGTTSRFAREDYAPFIRYTFETLWMQKALGLEMLIEDVLEQGLRVVFCGTALGRKSSERRAYYAHPRNMFWRTLHETGLTDRLLQPEEYQALLDYRIGLTDLCKSEFGNDDELSLKALDCAGLWAKMES